MLMPAGILVVLMLGAIAFDLSVLFLRQREASSLAADVANDLATLAVDLPTYRAGGPYQLDPGIALDRGSHLVALSDLARDVVEVDIEVIDPETVSVSVTVRVDYVFARSIPGTGGGTEVVGQATATAIPG